VREKRVRRLLEAMFDCTVAELLAEDEKRNDAAPEGDAAVTTQAPSRTVHDTV
jgi:hypothetical protein